MVCEDPKVIGLLLFNLATDADDPLLGFTTRWIQALAGRVECIRVITMRMGRLAVPPNVDVYSLGKEKGYSEARRLLAFYRYLTWILRTDRINVCFSHMIPIFTVLAAPLLKLHGIPIISWYAHPSLTATLKIAHHASTRMVASLETAYPYKKDKLVVLGQGIDTNLFSPGNGKPHDPPIILCTGRLSPVKDHPTLLKAANILRARWQKPFRITIVGGAAGRADETYVKALHELVQALGLQDITRFERPVPQAELPCWYQRCTTHVNLTPIGFGDKVAWEAMSCGRPCLAANRGFAQTFGRYQDRLLFRHGDAEDLAAKLEYLLRLSPEEGQELGLSLRERVIRLHSLNNLADRLVSLFHEVKPASAPGTCSRTK
jgi:glycosyltransferase involved in cell wall biosynthesis